MLPNSSTEDRSCSCTELQISVSLPHMIIVVQLLSHAWLLAAPWTAACQAFLSFTVSWSLLKLMSIESAVVSVSSSAVPFSSWPQSFPASGSFPMSQLFAWGDQIIGVCGDTQKNMLLTLKKTTLGMNKLNKQMILSSFWEIGNEQECLCKLNRMEKSWFYWR